MSGPYPPQGYPQQPGQGGWGGGQVGGGPSGPYGPANYPGGWQQQQPPRQDWQQQPPQQDWQQQQPPQQDQPAWNLGPAQPEPTPPPRKRNTGQIVTAVIAVLVIVGGVVTGIFLLNNHHQQSQQAGSTTTTQSAPGTTAQQSTGQQDTGQAGAANASGSTNVSVTAGQCVTVTTAGMNYVVGRSAPCASATSDFVLDKTVGQISDCAAHQYVVITGPYGSVYCFTIDVKAGDCVDSNYLKVACGTGAAFTVLKTEAGPGGDSSCRDVSGAQRWVPAGHPAEVACIGPPTN